MINVEELTRFIEKNLHLVIDELRPKLKPASDEEMIEEHEDHGVFTRDFVHKNGNLFRVKWKVFFGTPETVRTIFEPTEQLKT